MSSLQNTKQSFRWRMHTAERQIILFSGDLVVAVLALATALFFWGQRDWLDFSFAFLAERPPAWFFLLPVLWLTLNVEMYDVRRAARKSETFKGILATTGICLAIYLLIFFVAEPNSLPRRGVAVYIIAAAVLMVIWRLIYISIFTAPEFMRRVLVVGAGRAGGTLAKVVRGTWPPPFYLVGLVDDDEDKIGSMIEGFPVLCGSKDLMSIIEKEMVSDVVFAIQRKMNPDMLQALVNAADRGVAISTMPMAYEEILGRVPIFLLESDWLLRSFSDQVRVNGVYEILKRILDLVGGLAGSFGTALLLPFISLAIYLDSGGPIFYSQTRVGKNGRLYKIYKFRTMRSDSELDGKIRVTVENDNRITRFGRILRKSHLDELPQFINVLKGDMSLVGPRAERLELVNDLQTKIPFYRARLLVKPGITGWAQVNFGYAATVEDTAVKLEYDLYYIKHRSIPLDFIILLRTVGTVIGFRGQ